LHGNPGFSFTCASYIICYHATQIAQTFHKLQLFFICHNLHWELVPWDSHYLRYFHIHFDPTLSSNLKKFIDHAT
jgi:hypothetical protein